MALSKLEALQILFTTYVPFAALLCWGVPDPILNFYLAHPWELFFGTFTLPMLTLIYTTPGSRIRLAVPLMTAIAFCCYHATSLQFMPDRTNATYYDGRHIVLFLTTVDVLLLRRLYFDSSGKERSQVLDRDMGVKDDATWIEDYRTGPDVSTWRALKWAAHVFFSERDIGTGREAKNIPSFPGGQAPSRAKFLLYRGCAVIGAVVFLGFLNRQPRPSPDVFEPRKAKLLLSRPDITTENVIERIFSTLVWWIVLRIVLGLLYNAASFIGVATLLTAPHDWPPYFGSPTSAYTLRKFWA